MRVRLIQKILAVVIAAATTLITPGLVSAGGPNSDKNNSGGNSKTNSSQNSSTEDALKKNNIFTILPTRKENSGEIEKKDQIQPAFIIFSEIGRKSTRIIYYTH